MYSIVLASCTNEDDATLSQFMSEIIVLQQIEAGMQQQRTFIARLVEQQYTFTSLVDQPQTATLIDKLSGWGLYTRPAR